MGVGLHFGSEEYTSNKFTKSYQFWTPDLALYTGARQEEIASLYLENFEQHEGIWCIHINDNRDKHIKNKSSKRLIPLHPFLVNHLSIIRRVEELKRMKKVRFFPDLPDMKGKYGPYVSKWFNERFRPSVGIPGGIGNVFHRCLPCQCKNPSCSRQYGFPWVAVSTCFFPGGHVDFSVLYTKTNLIMEQRKVYS